ncbi:hypothetical protein [Endozoicomonas acroporae]
MKADPFSIKATFDQEAYRIPLTCGGRSKPMAKVSGVAGNPVNQNVLNG